MNNFLFWTTKGFASIFFYCNVINVCNIILVASMSIMIWCCMYLKQLYSKFELALPSYRCQFFLVMKTFKIIPVIFRNINIINVNFGTTYIASGTYLSYSFGKCVPLTPYLFCFILTITSMTCGVLLICQFGRFFYFLLKILLLFITCGVVAGS